MNDIRLLSIDPSVTCTGWALLWERRTANALGFEVVNSGHWRPSHAKGAPDRLQQLGDLVREMAGDGVTDVVVEMPTREQRRGRGGGRRRAGDLITYGVAAGVCYGAAVALGLRVWGPDVAAWKGRSSKARTAAVVRAVLGQVTDSHDENDAIGIGLWWMQRVRPMIGR